MGFAPDIEFIGALEAFGIAPACAEQQDNFVARRDFLSGDYRPGSSVAWLTLILRSTILLELLEDKMSLIAKAAAP